VAVKLGSGFFSGIVIIVGIGCRGGVLEDKGSRKTRGRRSNDVPEVPEDQEDLEDVPPDADKADHVDLPRAMAWNLMLA
jgi:hypothetical protein